MTNYECDICKQLQQNELDHISIVKGENGHYEWELDFCANCKAKFYIWLKNNNLGEIRGDRKSWNENFLKNLKPKGTE